MVYGTAAAYGVASPTQAHFGGSVKEIPGIGEIGLSPPSVPAALVGTEGE